MNQPCELCSGHLFHRITCPNLTRTAWIYAACLTGAIAFTAALGEPSLSGFVAAAVLVLGVILASTILRRRGRR